MKRAANAMDVKEMLKRVIGKGAHVNQIVQAKREVDYVVGI